MLPVALEDRLLDLVAETYWSIELWVDSMYPWGEPGTFLEKWDGPDVWQRKALQVIDQQLAKIAAGGVEGDLGNTIRMAVSSGHGVGKTALITWVIHWFMATRPNPQVVATAGTQNQLKTKTWREVKKWLDVCLVGHWFDWAQTSLQLKEAPTWKANAIPWSANSPQNFAGTHEEHVLYLFDEASTIDNTIWETSEGAFTTTGPHIWLAFGNPETATGRFRECWGFRRKWWITFEVDARDSKLANKALIRQWIEQYGEDSDFVRVRVKGQPPRTGPSQLIGTDLVEKAEQRFRDEAKKLNMPRVIPKIMGIDPAGGDSEHSAQTVFLLRQGPILYDNIVALREPDGMKVAALAVHWIKEWKPDLVFMDCHGLGKPIYDRIIQLVGGGLVIPCYAGDTDALVGDDALIYYNNRILWYSRLRAWLGEEGLIPYHQQLRTDLMAPQRHYNTAGKMQLESKDDMKLRGVDSPDFSDALAHTFAQIAPMRPGDEGQNVEPDNP